MARREGRDEALAGRAAGPGPNPGASRSLARVVAAVSLALVTANCASNGTTRTGRSTNKYGVAASPKVIPDGQPIPKGGGRDMVGKPYVVGARTYVPHAGRGYARVGEASWYGAAFHGRLTANGEVFDKDSVAAAHPTLPLPSYVRVTNLATHRSMIVRVNDRGPYERGRLIDLSERAAKALDFHRAGTTKVRVEYVGKASLGGSDDRKLLATLRSTAEPADTGRRGPVMLAALDEGSGGGDRAEAIARPIAPLAFKTAALPRARPASAIDDLEPPAPVIVATRLGGASPAPEPEEAPEPQAVLAQAPSAARSAEKSPALSRRAPSANGAAPAGSQRAVASLSPPQETASRTRVAAKSDRLISSKPGIVTASGKSDRRPDAAPAALAELPPQRPRLASADTLNPEAGRARGGDVAKLAGRVGPANMKTAYGVDSKLR